MEYTLRQATPADIDYSFNLHRATMRDYVEATWGWDDDWQRQHFEKNYDPDLGKIIQVHGQYAGVLITDDLPDALSIELIEVAPSYQRQGLGTTIITDLQETAAAADKAIVLRVLKTNVEAKRLYEQLGFVVDREEEHRFYMRWTPGSKVSSRGADSVDSRQSLRRN